MLTLSIIGCGGHARSVANVVIDNDGYDNIEFFDENAKNKETIFGFQVYSLSEMNRNNLHVAVGSNELRRSFIESHIDTIVSIVSNKAYLGAGCEIGKGSFIAHNVFVGPLVVIGKGVILNTGSIIEHESHIGDYTHIGPNSTICGRSKIGNNVFIGVGSTIIDSVSVCDNVIIGASSCIVEDITIPGTYVGSPAKKIK